VTAVTARKVTRRFGTFTAVDTASLDVAPGEIVGLVGANGAGKTTLIKMILGLLAPSAGTIRLFGEAPTRDQRRRIGYVPQNLGLYLDLTGDENLEFRADVFGVRAREDAHAAVRDAHELVKTLSLGDQRRLAFVAATQHRPELLVFDEPTSGVSPLSRSDLWDQIHDYADAGAAVLVSTHHMDEADQTDRLVVMARGRVVAHGTPYEIVDGRQVIEVRAARWNDALEALDARGWHAALTGRTVRVLSDRLDAVTAELTASGIPVEARRAPASLDEVMLALSLAPDPG
jgi:ABC-2 type transport system ATP-binding protein